MDLGTAVVILGLTGASKGVVEDFLKRVLGPIGDASGKVLSRPIEEWHRRRVERAARLTTDAATMLEEAGTEAVVVPGRILWPILERGSIEEEESLGRRWAALLANAADARGQVDVNPAFVRILAELTPREVAELDRVWRSAEEHRAKGWGTGGIRFWPSRERDDWAGTAVTVRHFISLGLIEEVLEYEIDVNDVGEQLAQAIKNEVSFGIRKVRTQVQHHKVTVFAVRFLEACQPPRRDAGPAAPASGDAKE